jgi:hypothetical protein
MIGNSIAGFLGTGVAVSASSYESIATATGTGSSATITFSSIPGTYSHLQIRGITKTTQTGSLALQLRIQLNGDTGTNYANHQLRGDGSSAAASGQITRSYINSTDTNASSATSPTNMANIFGVTIIDLIDYASTTKNKTVRHFSGLDANYASADLEINLGSGLWLNTAAVTSITLSSTDNFTSTTTFALYGIKG